MTRGSIRGAARAAHGALPQSRRADGKDAVSAALGQAGDVRKRERHARRLFVQSRVCHARPDILLARDSSAYRPTRGGGVRQAHGLLRGACQAWASLPTTVALNGPPRLSCSASSCRASNATAHWTHSRWWRTRSSRCGGGGGARARRDRMPGRAEVGFRDRRHSRPPTTIWHITDLGFRMGLSPHGPEDLVPTSWRR